MIQFIKDSLRELKHVVWPTRKETTQHFYLVVLILFLFGLYLFVFNNIFSSIMFWLKDIFGPETASVSSSLSEDEIDAIFSGEGNVELEASTASGELQVTTESQVTATGAEQ